MVAWHCWDTPHDLDVVLRPVRWGFRQIVFCQLFLYISLLTSSFPSVHWFLVLLSGVFRHCGKLEENICPWCTVNLIHMPVLYATVWPNLTSPFCIISCKHFLNWFSLFCFSLLFPLFLLRAALQPCCCFLYAALFSFVSSLLSGQ